MHKMTCPSRQCQMWAHLVNAHVKTTMGDPHVDMGYVT
jgi:hypothetical protein